MFRRHLEENSLAPEKGMVHPPPQRARYSYPHLGGVTTPIFFKGFASPFWRKAGEGGGRKIPVNKTRKDSIFKKRAAVGKTKSKRRVDLSILEAGPETLVRKGSHSRLGSSLCES